VSLLLLPAVNGYCHANKTTSKSKVSSAVAGDMLKHPSAAQAYGIVVYISGPFLALDSDVSVGVCSRYHIYVCMLHFDIQVASPKASQ
jgi:hypothetical protein